MDKGTYRGRRVNFIDYAASFFNPYLFVGSFRSRLGCGISALALLTGTPPENIASGRRGTHCSDAFMMRFLRRRGFRTLRLTQCTLSQASADVGTGHVVLLSQLFRENEGTWIVLFNGICYHNFDSYSLDQLSFLNKPILSAHLVIHLDWRLNTKLKPAPKIKPPRNGITMSALHKSGLGSSPVRPVRRAPPSENRAPLTPHHQPSRGG